MSHIFESNYLNETVGWIIVSLKKLVKDNLYGAQQRDRVKRDWILPNKTQHNSNWHLLFPQMTQKPPSKIKKYMLITKINLISYTERIRTTLSSGSSYFGLLLLDCQISSPSISPSLHFRFHNSTVVTMSTFLHKCCRFSSALHNFRLVKFKKKKGVTYNFNFCI